MQAMEQEGHQVSSAKRIPYTKPLNKRKTQLKDQVFIEEFKTINKPMIITNN